MLILSYKRAFKNLTAQFNYFLIHLTAKSTKIFENIENIFKLAKALRLSNNDKSCG